MNLIDRIKRDFKDVEIKVLFDPPDSIEVRFRRWIDPVIILKDHVNNRYSASYPALIRDEKGSWKTEERHSDGMLIDGLFWVLAQVSKYGKVKPEIVD